MSLSINNGVFQYNKTSWILILNKTVTTILLSFWYYSVDILLSKKENITNFFLHSYSTFFSINIINEKACLFINKAEILHND